MLRFLLYVLRQANQVTSVSVSKNVTYVDGIMVMKDSREGLLTNAKVYIHVTIWIKVVTQTAMYSQYYIHDLQRNK